MAEETTDFNTSEIVDSLGATQTSDGDEDNGQESENNDSDSGTGEGNESHGDGEDSGSEEDGNQEAGEGEEGSEDGEVDPDAEAASGSEDDGDGKGEEEQEVETTPEHEVGASLQQFMNDRLPPDRIEEGMENFKSSLNIVADQMNGDYENYWSGITPSLELAAIDDPAAFLDTLAPLYQKVLEGEGRMLTPENRQAVDNLEISEEMALKMQKNDRKLELSQRKHGIFEKRETQSKEQQETQDHQNNLTLTARETIAAMEKAYPTAVKMRDKVMESIIEEGVTSAREVKLLIENAYHAFAKQNPPGKRDSGHGEKKPLRSNTSSASKKVVEDPNADFSTNEIAAALKSKTA